MTSLSIITVVKNDHENLRKTIRSLDAKIIGKKEHLIIVSRDSKKHNYYLELQELYNIKVKIVDDIGIFSAMNIGILSAKGDYLWFMNAGDKFRGKLNVNELDGLTLLPVKYVDFRGVEKVVKLRKGLKYGMPYCHQGLIYRNSTLLYDEKVPFGADYSYTLNYFFRYGFKFKMLISGMVTYDTNGTSSVNRAQSDKYSAIVVRKHFGAFYYHMFMIRSKAKLMIKKLWYLAKGT